MKIDEITMATIFWSGVVTGSIGCGIMQVLYAVFKWHWVHP